MSKLPEFRVIQNEWIAIRHIGQMHRVRGDPIDYPLAAPQTTARAHLPVVVE